MIYIFKKLNPAQGNEKTKTFFGDRLIYEWSPADCESCKLGPTQPKVKY